MDFDSFKGSIDSLVAGLGWEERSIAKQRWNKSLPHSGYGAVDEQVYDCLLVSWQIDHDKFYESDDSNTFTNNDPSNFELLDLALEQVAPNITYLQYKRMMKDLVKTVCYTQSDYYTPTEYYEAAYIELDQLYNFLSRNNILELSTDLKP